MSFFIYYRTLSQVSLDEYAMMKISQVFDLHKKSITLRLFSISSCRPLSSNPVSIGSRIKRKSVQDSISCRKGTDYFSYEQEFRWIIFIRGCFSRLSALSPFLTDAISCRDYYNSLGLLPSGEIVSSSFSVLNHWRLRPRKFTT